jgi:serine O-acetyltransferase
MLQRIREDIACIFERDPAAQSTWEIITAYPGFHAVLMHRISHALWTRGWHWLGRFNSHLARWLTGIEIHPSARLGRRLFIDHGMGVVIGETAVIGDDCTLYHGVTLGGTSWRKGKRHPTIGNGVVIGAGAKVLGPITVGDNARVGSNSVVVKDVPPGVTVVGIPAHQVTPSQRDAKARLDDLATRMGFDPYGTPQDLPDPVARAINHILDHIQAMDGQMEAICHTLKEMGASMDERPMPDLADCGIDRDAGNPGEKRKPEESRRNS